MSVNEQVRDPKAMKKLQERAGAGRGQKLDATRECGAGLLRSRQLIREKRGRAAAQKNSARGEGKDKAGRQYKGEQNILLCCTK